MMQEILYINKMVRVMQILDSSLLIHIFCPIHSTCCVSPWTLIWVLLNQLNVCHTVMICHAKKEYVKKQHKKPSNVIQVYTTWHNVQCPTVYIWKGILTLKISRKKPHWGIIFYTLWFIFSSFTLYIRNI